MNSVVTDSGKNDAFLPHTRPAKLGFQLVSYKRAFPQCLLSLDAKNSVGQSKYTFTIWAEEVGQLLAKHHGKFACPLPIGFIHALTSAK